MATKVKRNQPNKFLLGQLITEKGFANQLDFAEKIGMDKAQFSEILNGMRIPSAAEQKQIKKQLTGVKDLTGRLGKWLTAVKISVGRKRVKVSQKEAIKATVQKTGTTKASVTTSGPGLQEVLLHLANLPGLPDEFFVHVVSYFKK